jgi:hypothetical protein
MTRNYAPGFVPHGSYAPGKVFPDGWHDGKVYRVHAPCQIPEAASGIPVDPSSERALVQENSGPLALPREPRAGHESAITYEFPGRSWECRRLAAAFTSRRE